MIKTLDIISSFLMLNVWMFSVDWHREILGSEGSSLSKETVNRGLRRHIVHSRLRLSNYYQFQDIWFIQKLGEQATCKFMRDLCVPLLLLPKTCTSHAHSSLASFHPNPPRYPLSIAPRDWLHQDISRIMLHHV